VGDNDKAAPEHDHGRQDESRTGVLKEDTAHVHIAESTKEAGWDLTR